MSVGNLLASKLIDSIERRTGQSMDYLREIRDEAGSAIWRFFFFVPLSAHGAADENEILAVARIAACRHEDCGTCLQIAVDDALARGVDSDVIAAAALGELEELDETQALVHRFADAIARVDSEAEGLRQELGARLPSRTMSDLALAIATARVYPAIKRAMGYATSCSLVQFAQPKPSRSR